MTAAILETGIAPNMTAGLSLGEYAAIATAGAMDIKTALLLVRKRGLLMQNATKDGFGGMAAVLGLEPDVLEALLKNTDAVTVANYNCPSAPSGPTSAVLSYSPFPRTEEKAGPGGVSSSTARALSVRGTTSTTAVTNIPA